MPNTFGLWTDGKISRNKNWVAQINVQSCALTE